jgi:hypothetical protein
LQALPWFLIILSKLLSFDRNINHIVVPCRRKKTARRRFLGGLAKSQSVATGIALHSQKLAEQLPEGELHTELPCTDLFPAGHAGKVVLPTLP